MGAAVYRRRQCKNCQCRWTTHERLVDDSPKRDKAERQKNAEATFVAKPAPVERPRKPVVPHFSFLDFDENYLPEG